jgi:hypothetical protein
MKLPRFRLQYKRASYLRKIASSLSNIQQSAKAEPSAYSGGNEKSDVHNLPLSIDYDGEKSSSSVEYLC